MIQRIIAFAYRDWLFARRNIFSVVEMLFWPIVGMLSIGLMGNFLKLTRDQQAFILTGAIALGTLQVSQLDVAYALLHDIWSKSVKHTFLTPTGVVEYLIGPWLIGIVRGTIVFALLAGFSKYAFGFYLPGVLPTVMLLAGLFLNALLMGGLVSILVLQYGQKAEISAWTFAYLFILVAGIYYPATQLPPFFYHVALFVPLTYFLDYFRTFYGTSAHLVYPLWRGFGLLAILITSMFVGLTFSLARARRTGVLLRLSE
jgi:ABC-2 type transport system permease protein